MNKFLNRAQLSPAYRQKPDVCSQPPIEQVSVFIALVYFY